MVDFGYSIGIISPELQKEFEFNCPHLENLQSNDFWPRDVTRKCNEVRIKIKDCLEGIHIYNIYRQCKPESSQSVASKKGIIKSLSNIAQKPSFKEPEITIWPSYCADDITMNTFLNSDIVKEKL